MNGKQMLVRGLIVVSSAVLLAAALSGCKASMPSVNVAFLKPSQPVIETLAEEGGSGSIALRNDNDRVPRSTVNLTAPHSVVVHAATERYLKDLVAELISHVPSQLASDKQVDVFLTSHDGSAHLYATGSDDILVGYGALTALRSRDELAFALSHELAHILLGHNQDQETIFSMDTAVKLVDKMLMLARTYELAFQNRAAGGAQQLTADQQRQLAQSVSEIRIAAHAIRSAVTGVLHGAWSRSQEREADRLGYDLLVAAGFNGEGAGRLLDRFGEEPSLRAEVAEHIDKMEKAANNLVAITDQGSYQQYVKQFGISSASRGFKAMLALVDDTHEAAAERKRELYEDYVDELGLDRNIARRIDERSYKRDLQRVGFLALKPTLDRAKQGYIAATSGGKPRSTTAIVSGSGSRIGFNRYALYEIRKEANKMASATRNLEIAWRNRPADFSTSSAYAVLLASSGNVDRALKIADFLEQTYASDAPFNDLRGRIHESAGDVAQAQQLWSACDSNAKSYVRKRCEYEVDRFEAEQERLALQADLENRTQLAQDPSTAYPPTAAGASEAPAGPLRGGLDQLKGLFGVPPGR
ncbi:MAG: M48 family metalloprotease [Gammaproteobacteria bacterium]|nr:M48 family metalloprotease [Gammaproteobacteria bacterium]